jgi:hypothetical protein
MFLNFIKEFRLKKIVKKTLSNYQAAASNGEIATVGIVLDETYFKQKEALINKLVQNGIKGGNIETLSFHNKLRKGEQPDCCYYTPKDVTSGGDFSRQDVKAFVNKPFDLLISYYDVAKPWLVLATLKSKASFKVGFSTVDNRLNSFMIASQAEKHEEFSEELIKYLRILNKL